MVKDSVPITAATDLMVTKPVRIGVADGAVRLVVKDGETKPVEEADMKLTVLKMKAKRMGGDDLYIASHRRGGWNLTELEP